jgi:hypothetical protein
MPNFLSPRQISNDHIFFRNICHVGEMSFLQRLNLTIQMSEKDSAIPTLPSESTTSGIVNDSVDQSFVLNTLNRSGQISHSLIWQLKN